MVIMAPINFFWLPEYNVNFVRGIGHEQHVMSAGLYFVGYLIVVPAVIYWPTHLALRRCYEGQLEPRTKRSP